MDRLLVACSCGLDPATETMAVNAAAALALSTPFWFREQIGSVIRRLRGRARGDADRAEDHPPQA